jgi:hypothetical protein
MILTAQCDLGDQTGTVRQEAWRRIRAPILLVGIAFVGLMAVVSIAWGQLVGVVVALGFIMLVGVAEVIAQWRDATETVIAEAIGREQTRRRLNALEADGWRCAHRVPVDGSQSIDHVAWGPRGIFVVATRSDRGRVGVESGVLTLGGMMPPRHYIQDVHNQVNAVKALLKDASDKRIWVEGVICMTRAFVDGYQIRVSKPPTTIVHVEKLLDFLETFEGHRALTAAEVAGIGAAFERLTA